MAVLNVAVHRRQLRIDLRLLLLDGRRFVREPFPQAGQARLCVRELRAQAHQDGVLGFAHQILLDPAVALLDGGANLVEGVHLQLRRDPLLLVSAELIDEAFGVVPEPDDARRLLEVR